MDCLFIGGVFDQTLEEEIFNKSKTSVHYAANKLQWNIIDGLFASSEVDLELLSALFIGPYPRGYTDWHVNGAQKTYKESIPLTYVSFNNLWGYRNISRRYHLQDEVKTFAHLPSSEKVILVYTPHLPLLQTAVYAKKIDPAIHICLIIPDLPQFMTNSTHTSRLYKELKKIDINLFHKNVKDVDSFVLLTEQMKEQLNVGTRPYVVIEGMVGTEFLTLTELEQSEVANEELNIVYTGTVDEQFGVIHLIEAFKRLSNKRAALTICGRGDSESLIKQHCLEDKRIKYLGQLSNQEATVLQASATVLVNPRQNNMEFTKYSFPSKNLEYLLSGRPVIVYKLDGIPDEYDDYFIYPESNSVEDLKKVMESILSMDEEVRNEIGQKGRNFVIREKNNVVAAKKIIDMFKKTGVTNHV